MIIYYYENFILITKKETLSIHEKTINTRKRGI